MSSATRLSCWQGADLTDPVWSGRRSGTGTRRQSEEDPRRRPINVVDGSLP
jgi:hypothetical protein